MNGRMDDIFVLLGTLASLSPRLPEIRFAIKTSNRKVAELYIDACDKVCTASLANKSRAPSLGNICGPRLDKLVTQLSLLGEHDTWESRIVEFLWSLPEQSSPVFQSTNRYPGKPGTMREPDHDNSTSFSNPTIQQSLHGKIAVVSGSCSGIGAGIARELSSRGAHVVINYPFSNLEPTANGVLRRLPTSGIAVEADLSTLDGPAKLVNETVKAYGKVDILVNNAGVAVNLPFSQQTLEHWDHLVNLNGRGPFLLTQATLPYLPKRGGGRIVNVVSSSARDPPVGQTIYAGTKGMVDSFTRCWAKELPPTYGCTVNAVSPGATRTEGFADAGPDAMKYLQPHIDATPCAPRLGEVDEIAFAVGFLCEERARWINGTHLHVNGGLFVG